ncbi:hypothetical protein VTN31DRAFT_782 [Thermomyces dupontii]|uniref:uncharacterized protein n=1 Tax=Talaromyces thermophilus TaxID=28565 RepID=UPI003741F43B
MDNRGTFFFVILVLYLILSAQVRTPSNPEHDEEQQRQLAEELRALQLLNRSQYGDFDPPKDKWLSVPGLGQNDSFSWDLLPTVQNRALRNVHRALERAGVVKPDQPKPAELTSISLPVYHNVTSKLRGEWVRHAKSHGSRLNMTDLMAKYDYATSDFGLNITSESGTLYVELHEGTGQELQESQTSHVREIKADLTVESTEGLGKTWYMSLFGLHFPKQGSIILTTTSEKFNGLSSLPLFTLSEDMFNLSQRLVMKSLQDTITERRRQPTFFPWSSLPSGGQAAFSTPKCEYIIYLQQHPVMARGRLVDSELLQQIENELRSPMGAPIPPPPMIEMSAILFSPDCGMIFETKAPPEYPPSDTLYLVGPKQEEYTKAASRVIYGIAGITCAQIYLLVRQMKDASTPSTRSRIGFYTIALMAMGDSIVISFTLLSLFLDTTFVVLAAGAFLVFLSVGFIGIKFMMDLWAVQAPERRGRDQRRENRSEGLPPPATAANSGAAPIIIPSDQGDPMEDPNEQTNRGQSEGSDVGTMYARFYFTLCCLSIVTLWSFVWPNKLGAAYARVLAFIYFSFWVPQIYRNVMRNCRKALRWEFVVGQSILRLLPFVYFLTVRDNILFIRPDTTTALALAAWVWIQVWTLVSQNIVGPRFFVPRGWAPPAYDYHPIIRDTSTGDDLESGSTLPIGALRAEERDADTGAAGDSSSSSSSRPSASDKPRAKDRKKKIFDCAICMQDIEVPVLTTSGGGIAGSSVTDGASSILGRRAYMVTPCRHIFHTACLESWMKLRLQCPICRESIPPV